DKQYAVLVAQPAQRGKKAGRRHVIAPFPLDRLDEDGSDLLWRSNPLEDSLLDLLDAGADFACPHASLAASRERHMMNVRHRGREAAAMHALRARQRHGTISAAVESAEESDGARAMRVPAGQLEPCFERLGAAVGKEDALRRTARRQLREPLSEIDLWLIIEIGSGHVD